MVAWRRRDADLLWLHLLVGTAAATALVAITRILGPIWPYLVLSAWGITALMVLATLLTFVPLTRGGDVRILAAIAAVAPIAFAVDSAYTEPDDADLATAAGRLSTRTAEQLDEDRTYLLRIVDPVHFTSPGFGVELDLEKKGFDVRLDEYYEVAVRPHRIGTPDDADAVLRFVVGRDLIAKHQRHDDAELLAEVDPPGQEPPLAMFLEPVPSARS